MFCPRKTEYKNVINVVKLCILRDDMIPPSLLFVASIMHTFINYSSADR